MPAPAEQWTPAVSEGERLTIETIVGQALGTASMCWEEPPHGTFSPERAKWVLEGALAAIHKLNDGEGALLHNLERALNWASIDAMASTPDYVLAEKMLDAPSLDGYRRLQERGA